MLASSVPVALCLTFSSASDPDICTNATPRVRAPRDTHCLLSSDLPRIATDNKAVMMILL